MRLEQQVLDVAIFTHSLGIRDLDLRTDSQCANLKSQ